MVGIDLQDAEQRIDLGLRLALRALQLPSQVDPRR